MAKIYKLTKGGQTIYPATTTDAVVNPNGRKSLTTEISEIDARISGKKEYSVGKNIINPSNLTDGYYLRQDGSLKQLSSYCVTVYISIEGNTQYHISKTGVGGAYHVIFDDNLKVLTAIKDGTVTTPENAAYIRLSISKSQLGAAQMELGDVATSYEPFTDNYDNEQKFVRLETQMAADKTELETQMADKKSVSLGKNLFNKLTVKNGYYIDASGNLKTNSTLSLSHYIKVNPNTSYYIQNTNTGGASNVWFDKEFNAIEEAAKSGVTTSPSNAAYIRLSISTAVIDNAMFFEGSTATSYEPFTDNYDNEQKFVRLETQMAADKTELETQMADKKSVSLGKNLFNKLTVKNGYYIDASGNLKTNSTLSLSHYIKVNPNTSYYIQNTNTGGASNVWFDKEFNAIEEAAKSGVTTSPSNAAYIRLSISTAVIDNAMFFEGSTATSYEPYTENYDNEQRFAKQEEAINNTNATLDTLQSQMPKVVVGKNLFDPDKAGNGFLRQDGTVANSTTYVTSGYIAVEGGKMITAHPLALGPIYFSQYDSDKTFITSTQNKQTLTITLESNTAYVRATFLASNYKTEGQIEYGSTATEYEPFHYVISEESLPEGIGSGTTQDEVKQIINEEVFPAKLVLPSSLYFKANRQNNLYYKQAIKCSCHDNFDFSVSNTTLKVFDRQLSGVPVAASVFNNKLTLRKFGKLLQELQVKFNILANPSSHKTVKILDSGDSISDLGGWQVELKNLLEEDNVTVEYIGTMINRTKTTGSSYAEDIWGEVQSGGNMSFITEPKGAAKILTVSGITELPVTGYPGTSYLDGNNISWVVRGFRLTAGSDGKYSGKLKLGKFSSDPNYGDGTEDDTSGTGNFPSSGTITKTQSANGNTLAGDATITYTSADDARYNPFWNPSTDELDFKYYFDYWGFDAPDIFILQWGYNEVKSYEDVNSESVQTARLRAKQIIDKFHNQYPDTKFVFGLEVYGAELMIFSGGSNNNNSPKKYSVLSFAEEIISLFEGNDDTGNPYSDYVTLVPVYAMMDNIYGYGSLSEKSLCDLYGATTTVLQNGRDGVHPSYDSGGLREIGRAYEPVVLAIINL